MNPSKSVVVTWPESGTPEIWLGGQLSLVERERALRELRAALDRDIARSEKARAVVR
jgi:hypothetical protein